MLLAESASAADWIAAVGQAAGALFTAAAVGVAVWLGWRDRKWRRADQADRERSQARLVISDLGERRESQGPGVQMIDFVKITNSSPEPIFDARVDDMASRDHPELGWRLLDGGRTGRLLWAAVLSPGGSAEIDIEYLDAEGAPVEQPGGWIEITVSYTAARGLRWSRSDANVPQRVIESRDLLRTQDPYGSLPGTASPPQPRTD